MKTVVDDRKPIRFSFSPTTLLTTENLTLYHIFRPNHFQSTRKCTFLKPLMVFYFARCPCLIDSLDIIFVHKWNINLDVTALKVHFFFLAMREVECCLVCFIISFKFWVLLEIMWLKYKCIYSRVVCWQYCIFGTSAGCHNRMRRHYMIVFIVNFTGHRSIFGIREGKHDGGSHTKA